jgi:hypothetical protein
MLVYTGTFTAPAQFQANMQISEFGVRAGGTPEQGLMPAIDGLDPSVSGLNIVPTLSAGAVLGSSDGPRGGLLREEGSVVDDGYVFRTRQRGSPRKGSPEEGEDDAVSCSPFSSVSDTTINRDDGNTSL